MEVFVAALVICTVGPTAGHKVSYPVHRDELNGNGIEFDQPSGQAVENSEVFFTLYNSQSSADNGGIPVAIGNSSDYLKSLFNPQLQTKFIVHGWLSSEGSDTVNYTAYEYSRVQGGNIVKVDWSHDASYKLYPLSALQVAHIGGIVADFLNKLLSIQVIELKTLHLIGHSLGAHVMGNAGAGIKGGKPARITGLDPAKPGFEGITPENYRLDASDGDFVDVIHTAAGAAGYYTALGQVDFYPNEGMPPQPGCFDITQPWQLSCSHARSYYYFIESISNPTGFQAIQCDTWSNYKSGACDNNERTYMGDATPSTAKGVFYLETNREYPFAKS